jgi:hypothetical protein
MCKNRGVSFIWDIHDVPPPKIMSLNQLLMYQLYVLYFILLYFSFFWGGWGEDVPFGPKTPGSSIMFIFTGYQPCELNLPPFVFIARLIEAPTMNLEIGNFLFDIVILHRNFNNSS